MDGLPSGPGGLRDDVARLRRDLAAAYRLIAIHGLDDSIYTHISARLPDGPDGRHRFLLNPFGLRFDEVTPDNLVTIDETGSVLDDPFGNGVNAAGFTIHSAIHMAREDVACVVHTHTVAGVAVSSVDEGLLPLNQWSAQFYGRTAYHPYEGIALDLDERQRLVTDLGGHFTMVLRNHGLLTCGRTVGEAVIFMLNLERACQAQVAAFSMGLTPKILPANVAEHTARQYEADYDKAVETGIDPEWDALVRLVARHDPTFPTRW